MKNLSLRFKLLLTSTLCLIILTATLLWLSLSSLSANIKQTLDHDVDLFATAFAERVGAWLDDRRNSIKEVALAIPQNPNVEPYQFLDLVVQGLQLSLAYYGTEQGEMYRSTRTDIEGYDPRVRSWYKGAMANQGSFLADPFTSATSGEFVVTLAEPVRRNNRIIGVVGGNLTLDTLTENVNALEVPGNGYAILIDRNGQLVAHPNSDWQRKPAVDFSPFLSQERLEELTLADALVETDIAGQQSFVFSVGIPTTEWTLVLVMDKATMMAPVTRQLYIQLGTALLIVVVAVGALLALFKVLFKSLETVSSTLHGIASGNGDLTQRLPIHSNDEIGQLSGNFNRFVEQLHGIVSRLVTAANELRSQADSAALSAQKQHDRVQRHKSEIDMVATAVTEMSSATQEIAGNAERTADSARDTVKLSNAGQQQVDKSQQSIETLANEVSSASNIIAELNQHAQKINSILSTISDISDQTNLLALNAAIEAARAGEHGRGFAVVADEVRMLSSRTNESTKEIEEMISALGEATERAVDSMNKGGELASHSVADAVKASDSLKQIAEAISAINDRATQIAAAAEEQASVTVEINRNTETIREVGDEMATESEVASNTAKRLLELSNRLNEDVLRFKI